MVVDVAVDVAAAVSTPPFFVPSRASRALYTLRWLGENEGGGGAKAAWSLSLGQTAICTAVGARDGGANYNTFCAIQKVNMKRRFTI